MSGEVGGLNKVLGGGTVSWKGLRGTGKATKQASAEERGGGHSPLDGGGGAGGGMAAPYLLKPQNPKPYLLKRQEDAAKLAARNANACVRDREDDKAPAVACGFGADASAAAVVQNHSLRIRFRLGHLRSLHLDQPAGGELGRIAEEVVQDLLDEGGGGGGHT